MNGIIRTSFRLHSVSGLLGTLGRNMKKEHGLSRLYSTVWNSCAKPIRNITPKSIVCTQCSGQINSYSTNSIEAELVEYLEKDIALEEKMHKTTTIPSKIDDFEVKLDGSEVTLEKVLPNESITITFNINNSVDESSFAEPGAENEEAPNLKSKPEFQIDIKRGDTTLGFTCSYAYSEEEDFSSPEDDLGGTDVFTIDEITLYTGEWTENTYAVNTKIIDGRLYDLLMNLLAEKGITDEFAEKMAELSSIYENSSYISLLRGLKKFTSS